MNKFMLVISDDEDSYDEDDREMARKHEMERERERNRSRNYAEYFLERKEPVKLNVRITVQERTCRYKTPLSNPLGERQRSTSEKTRLCYSVTRGGKCPHGQRCRFAHHVSELRCKFGQSCNQFKAGIPCRYRH